MSIISNRIICRSSIARVSVRVSVRFMVSVRVRVSVRAMVSVRVRDQC